MSDEQLELLGEQYHAIQSMTFLQFVEAVRSNRIQLNGKEIATRGTSNIPYAEEAGLNESTQKEA